MVERIAYTPAEACEALRVGRTKLYGLIGQQKLKAVALGGKTLIPRAEVERFLESLPSIQLRAEKGGRNVAP
jgi:excisionase family DNA binding protein